MKRKWFLFFVLIVVLLLIITSCTAKNNTAVGNSEVSQSGDNFDTQSLDVLLAYKKVELGMTKEEVEGVNSLEGQEDESEFSIEGTVNYLDLGTGFGVSVIYNDDNVAFSKTALYNSHDEIAPFCTAPVEESQKSQLSNGMDYAEVVSILGGDGVEVNIIAMEDTPTIPFGYMCRWVNTDGTGFQITFSGENKITGILYFDHN